MKDSRVGSYAVITLVMVLLLKVVLLPYTLNSTRNDLARQLQSRRLIGGVWKGFTRYLVWSGVLTVRFNGLEKLGRPGQLVLSNHPSLLDVVLLIGHVPEMNCIVKKDLLKNPSMKSQILAAGYIPNDESLEMMEEVVSGYEAQR